MVLNCSRRHQVYDEQRGHPIPGISHASGGVSLLQRAESIAHMNASFYVSGSTHINIAHGMCMVYNIYNYVYPHIYIIIYI